MLGQTFNQGWSYLNYLIEKKAYIARCENKARPQLHCDGKCVLMKRILEQEKKERGNAPELKLTAKGDIISSRSFFITSFQAIETLSNDRFVQATIGSPVSRASSLFHPPNFA